MFRINLFFLFVIVPIAEIALLVQVGQFLGFWPTMGLVILTAAIGSSIAAREGVAALAGLSQAGGESVSVKLADAAIILVCGFLLLTPGLITDVVGLLGLFPVTRPIIRKFVLNQFGKRVSISSFAAGQARQPGQPGQNQSRYSDPTGTTDQKASGASGTIISGSASETPEYARKSSDDRDV